MSAHLRVLPSPGDLARLLACVVARELKDGELRVKRREFVVEGRGNLRCRRRARAKRHTWTSRAATSEAVRRRSRSTPRARTDAKPAGPRALQ